MEIQLQELIDKIKKDGINTASEEAAKLKQAAEAEAAGIVAAARKEAAEIVNKGKEDAARAEKAGKAAIEQAYRNLILSFKAEIQALLDKIVSQGISTAYGGDTLKAILPDLLKAWVSKSGSDSVDLLLNEQDLVKLNSWASGTLAAELKKGIELKSSRGLGAGFRIANKDGSAYYDFSAEAVADLFSAYLNPQLADLIKNSSKGI